MYAGFVRGAVVAFFAVCAGCGPQMKTTYEFVPPQQPGADRCLDECAGQRQECVNTERFNYISCRQDEQSWKYDCLRVIDESERAGVFNLEAERCKAVGSGTRCVNGSYLCDSHYRSCYQLCGGRVIERSVCVARCN